MNMLLAMLSEDGSGQSVSTMRVCALLVVGCVMGAWAVVSIKAGALQAISPEQLGLVLGVLGLKAWQRGKENEPTPAPKGN